MPHEVKVSFPTILAIRARFGVQVSLGQWATLKSLIFGAFEEALMDEIGFWLANPDALDIQVEKRKETSRHCRNVKVRSKV